MALRMALRLSGDADTAEDLVQETLCRVLRQWRTYRGEASFRSWLLQILVNVDRDRRRRRTHLSIADDDEAEASSTSVGRCGHRGRVADAGTKRDRSTRTATRSGAAELGRRTGRGRNRRGARDHRSKRLRHVARRSQAARQGRRRQITPGLRSHERKRTRSTASNGAARGVCCGSVARLELYWQRQRRNEARRRMLRRCAAVAAALAMLAGCDRAFVLEPRSIGFGASYR